jgi:hypothetical protein
MIHLLVRGRALSLSLALFEIRNRLSIEEEDTFRVHKQHIHTNRPECLAINITLLLEINAIT